MNRIEKQLDADGVFNRIVGKYSLGEDLTRPVGKVIPKLGIFVALEPDFEALVHVNRIAGLGGQDPRRFYATGQLIKAKIVNIDFRNQRVELETNLREFSFEGFLREEDQIVAHNAKLAEIDVTGGMLSGSWISDRPEARVELVKRDECEMSLQLQAKCEHNGHSALKVVHVILRQEGQDVLARADWAAMTSSEHDYGYDLTKISKRRYDVSADEGGVAIATSEDLESESSQGYGVVRLDFRRKPLESIQSMDFLTAESSPETILVDGNNIVRRWPNLRSEALIALIEALKTNGYAPTVFFDANISYVLKSTEDTLGQELLRHMLEDDPEHTVIIPAGMRADDYMLLLADRRGYHIVSCDTFRDEAFERYEWLANLVESGEKRLHPPAFILGDLVIPTLGIICPYAQMLLDKPLFGGDVFIQAQVNGRFFCAEEDEQCSGRPIVANRDNASDWEKFVLVRNPDRSVSIKSRVNAKFISVNAEGRLVAQADRVEDGERFWMSRRVDGGYYVLRSCAAWKYVSVESQSGLVIAQADIPREPELLTITPCV